MTRLALGRPQLINPKQIETTIPRIQGAFWSGSHGFLDYHEKFITIHLPNRQRATPTTLAIEYLAIMKPYRRQGYGTLMIEEVIERALREHKHLSFGRPSKDCTKLIQALAVRNPSVAAVYEAGDSTGQIYKLLKLNLQHPQPHQTQQ